jgi:hypothetical protein
MLQNSQVLARGGFRRALLSQPVAGHAKAAVGEQVLAVAVVLEGAGLAHQLVDDVPVVDRVLVSPDQSRQRLDPRLGMPDLHAIGVQAGLDLVPNQSAVNRVDVAMDMDQASRVHAHGDPLATVQPLRRQGGKRGELLRVPLSAAGVPRRHHLLNERLIILAAGEVAAAAEQKRLVEGRLEVPVRRLVVPVLVRLADVDPLARQAVMLQQAAVARLKLAWRGQVVDRRREAVAAMAPRSAAQLPEGVLQPIRQRLERLGEAQGHRLPVRPGQHEVVHQVLEGPSEERDLQRVHAGEVGGRQIAGEMHLAEHDLAWRAGGGSPLPHAPLEGASLAVSETFRQLLLEPVKERLGL